MTFARLFLVSHDYATLSAVVEVQHWLVAVRESELLAFRTEHFERHDELSGDFGRQSGFQEDHALANGVLIARQFHSQRLTGLNDDGTTLLPSSR